MKVTCDACGARFKIDDGKIPDQGLAMSCPKCSEQILVQRDGHSVTAAQDSEVTDMPPIPPDLPDAEQEDVSPEPGLSTSDNALDDVLGDLDVGLDESSESTEGSDDMSDDVFEEFDMDSAENDLSGDSDENIEFANSADDDGDGMPDFSFDDALSDLDGDLALDAQESLPPVPSSKSTAPDTDDDPMDMFDQEMSNDLSGDVDDLPPIPQESSIEPELGDDFSLDVPSLLENAAAELEKEMEEQPAPIPEGEDLPEIEADGGFSFDDMIGADEIGSGDDFLPGENLEDMLGQAESTESQDSAEGSLPPLDFDSEGSEGVPQVDPFLDGLQDLAPGDATVQLYQVRRPNGKIFGPFPPDTILDMIRTAKLQGTEEVSASGEDWVPLSEIETFAEEVKNAANRQTVLETFMPEHPQQTDLESERKKVLEASKKRRRSGSLEVVSPMKQKRIRFGKKSIAVAAIIGVLLLFTAYMELVEEVSVIDVITLQSTTDKPFYQQLRSRARQRFDKAQEELAKDNYKGAMKAREICLEMLKRPDFRGVEVFYALLAQIDYHILIRYSSASEIIKESTKMAKIVEDLINKDKREDPDILFAKATRLMYEKKYNEAKDVLLKVTVRDTKSSTKALQLIAEAYLYLPDKKPMQNQLEKVIQAGDATARTYYLQGRMFDALGQYEKAKASFSKALELDSQHLDSQIELAGILLKEKGGLNKAERELKTLRKSFKESMSKKQLARVHYYSAQIYKERDEPYKVVKELTAAIDNEPGNYLYNEMLGMYYLKKREYAKAQEQLSKCIENYYNDIECHLALSKALLRLGHADQALFKLEEATKLAPENAELAFLTGKTYEKLYKPEKALKKYERAINLNPKGVAYYTSAAMSYLQQDNLTKAGEYVQKAKLIDPASPLVHNFVGQMHLHQNDIERAKEEFKKAIQIDPTFIEARHMLAITLRDTGSYEDALEQYEQILNLDDKDDRAYYGLGRTFFEMGELEKAITEYEKAVNINDKNHEYWFHTGVAYYTNGNLDKAKTAFERASQLAPSFAEASFYLGRIYMDQSEYDRAVEFYDQALSLDKKDPRFYFYYGLLMLKREKYTDAIEYFDKALALNKDYAEAYLFKGITLRKQNKFVHAIKMFNKAKQLSPEVNTAIIELGDCYLEMRKYDDAIKQFSTAIEKEPENAEAHAKLGRVYQEIGQQRKAITFLKKAVELDVNDPMAHLGLGYAFKALRKKKDAISEFEKYIELNPTAIDRKEVEDEIYWLRNQ